MKFRCTGEVVDRTEKSGKNPSTGNSWKLVICTVMQPGVGIAEVSYFDDGATSIPDVGERLDVIVQLGVNKGYLSSSHDRDVEHVASLVDA